MGSSSNAGLFGLEHADELVVEEEQVGGRTAAGLKLAQGDALGGGEIEVGPILDVPAAGGDMGRDCRRCPL